MDNVAVVQERPRLLRQALRLALAIGLPRERFMVSGPRTCGAVGLTFDDGPHPEHTPRLLDTLGELGVPATFFVIGSQAERFPNLVRRMATEGHAVGGHSYYHTPPGSTSAAQLLDEVRRTRELLAGLLGEPPSLFRPPFGKITAGKLWSLWRAGQSIVLWNVDSKDYASRTADEARARLERRPLQAGDLLLMHDNHPHASELLPGFVSAVRGRGLGFTTVLPWVRPALDRITSVES